MFLLSSWWHIYAHVQSNKYLCTWVIGYSVNSWLALLKSCTCLVIFSGSCDVLIIFMVQLVLLGDSGVGKSCIVLRFVRGQFDPTSKVTELWMKMLLPPWLHSSCFRTSIIFNSFQIIGNCWCIVFITNIGIGGFNSSKVWNLGYCWTREVDISCFLMLGNYMSSMYLMF